jgi:hypothetical protein
VPNEPEIRNCEEVIIVDHGPGVSTEVWIGDDLVIFTKKLTYYPPEKPADCLTGVYRI